MARQMALGEAHTFAEWDEASAPGLEAPGYSVQEGYVHVPSTPGFGLVLDDALFGRAIERDGFVLTAD